MLQPTDLADPSRDVHASLLTRVERARKEPSDRSAVDLRAVEVGGEERASLWAHAPARVRFERVRVPSEARLQVGIGIAGRDDLESSDGVRFVVHVADDAGTQVLWSRVLDPANREEDRSWVDVELPLDRWAGSTVDLLFETRARDHRENDHSAWSRLVLFGEESERELEPIPVERPVETLSAAGSNRLRVPAGSRLVVAGTVKLRGAAAEEPKDVRFRASVDGDVVLEKAVPARERRTNFSETVSLRRWWEDPVVVDFEILRPPELGGAVEAEWTNLSVLSTEPVPRRRAGSGPNVLFVLVDTLRADRLGTYGYSRETSPNLDALAKRGAVFEEAVSQSSWTMPATASLVTGRYPPAHGVTDGQSLPQQARTLAEEMQQRGLSTLGISANPLIGEAEGFAQGHETFVHMPWARAETMTGLLLQMIREQAHSRWYGYAHYIDPHDPYSAPEPYGSYFQDPERDSRYRRQDAFRELVNAVNFGRGTAEWDPEDLRYLNAAYDGEIRYWDRQFERLLDGLRRNGLLEDTVVVVTSDHGEEFLEHGRLKHGLQLYRESVRVPLIVHGPGVAAGRHRAPVETRRLFHLCKHLASLSSGNDPIRVREALEEAKAPVFTHTDHGKLDGRPGRVELAAVRDDRWKLIRLLASSASDGMELYDLEDDARERTNLASARRSITSRYAGFLESWLEEASESKFVEGEREPEVMRELRALGYIE